MLATVALIALVVGYAARELQQMYTEMHDAERVELERHSREFEVARERARARIDALRRLRQMQDAS